MVVLAEKVERLTGRTSGGRAVYVYDEQLHNAEDPA